MSDKRMLKMTVTVIGTVVALIGLAALLIVSGGVSQVGFAQGPDVGIQAAVDEAFTYQGRLLHSSVPVSGTCSLTFKLYYTASGPGQVGIHDTHTGVPINDGYFSVDVNDSGEFGSLAFIGEARWLEITVDSCTGGGGAVTLSPRVALKAVPYAHTLRPGAEVESSLDSASLLAMENDGQGGGVFVRIHSTTNQRRAGSFVADGSSGETQAVFAANDSTSDEAAAGYFHAAGATGKTYAVYAENNSVGGSSGDPFYAYGGYFLTDGGGRTYAVYAENHNTTERGAAGYFLNASSGRNGYTYGVYAQNNSYGIDSAAGYFFAAATTGETRGVYAQVDSSGTGDGYPAIAGYFRAWSSTGRAHGIVAETRSTNEAKAGSFWAEALHGQNYGVYARNFSSTDKAAAGYFSIDGGATYGVHAVNSSTSDHAAAGYFQSKGTGGQSAKVYGVWAETDNPSNFAYAVYADKTTCLGTAPYCYAIYTNDKIHAAQFDTSASDVAEYYPSRQSLQPGDVVMADLDGGGRVIRAEGTYNKAVLGVISTAPGVSLGSGEHEGGDGNAGKALVTLIGRVPCKVSAENGPIRPGDLLTTSSTPGHAMAAGSDPLLGSIVGKALDALDSGTGVIDILVMLQ